MLRPETFIQDIDIFTKEKGVAVIIRVPEVSLDVNNALEIKKRVVALVECNFSLLIIDLQNCDRITEDGFGGLVACYKEAMNQRCHIVFCSLQKQVEEYFKLTRIDKAFEIDTDSEAALKKYLTTRITGRSLEGNAGEITVTNRFNDYLKIAISVFVAFMTALIVFNENGEDFAAVLLSTPITVPCIFYAIKKIGKRV